MYFTDPLLRAPLIASMLMCMASSLLSVLLFVRKKTLLAEPISHATYPGVILGVLLAVAVGCEKWMALFILGGGFVTAQAGVFAIDFLKKKLNVREDAALCFVLASFFGVGVTLLSRVQFLYPAYTRSIQGYLYGQAATMGDFHIYLYGALSFVILLAVLLFYKELKTASFDPLFARTAGTKHRFIDLLLYSLVVLAVVIGIRSVGVVLMSAMLVAPGIAARRLTQSLSKMFFFSAAIGMFSAFSGCLLSFKLETALPTGPLIVIIASLFAMGSLLLAPRQGLLVRYFRILIFRLRCMEENLLKALWRKQDQRPRKMKKECGIAFFSYLWIYLSLRRKKLIISSGAHIELTQKGFERAQQIVRLHRLWEVYLVEYLGLKVERVHKSAEEMEHILTPQLEEELTKLLKDPKQDPHHQPIPGRERAYG